MTIENKRFISFVKFLFIEFISRRCVSAAALIHVQFKKIGFHLMKIRKFHK